MGTRQIMSSKVLLLGFGQTAKAVLASLADTTKVYATTRNPMRIFELYDYPVEPIILPVPSAEVIAPLAHGSNVLVSFPPDGTTDQILSTACRDANAIVYISSTGVYGSHRGEVTDDTPVAVSEGSVKLRLEAEDAWRAVGGTVLRAPGIYGPDNGLHKRLLENSYAIPGDGTGVISRIHLEDLAQFVIACWERKVRSETYVVGDLQPTPQIEVVTWLCQQMGLQLPRFAALDAVSPTLRGSRRVNPSRAIADLGVALKYPDYKTGFTACLDNIKSA
jgi:nucleoside-diphosphate-sugar epimerase